MSASLTRQAREILKQLTLAEKVLLLSGSTTMATAGLPRFGLKPLVMTDGPHGVTSAPSTCFPSGVALAASWDPALVHDVAEVMAEEALALGKDILLGPCVNMVRHPLAGRNFESIGGEDPHLSGTLGVAYVQGMHSKGVGASLKHFACNNQETERLRGDSVVDERTLRDFYLPHFERIVKETDPWTVMCAYNRLNGAYASQNRALLTDVLKCEWGYTGVVVSDWGANHTIVDSVKAGLDLEMPGPARYYGKNLIDAVISWEIDEAAVDAAALRMVRLLLRGMDARSMRPRHPRVNTPAHQALARRAAAESVVLLKNTGSLLPVDLRTVRRLAVVGPNASVIVRGGGSSNCTPPRMVTPLEALRKVVGSRVKLDVVAGCENRMYPVIAAPSLFRTPDGKHRGLRASYFDNSAYSGAPVVAKTTPNCQLRCSDTGPVEGVAKENFSVRWEGRLRVPASGLYRVHGAGFGDCRVVIDGRDVVNSRTRRIPGRAWFDAQWYEDIELSAGRDYRILVEYDKTRKEESAFMHLAIALSPEHQWQQRIDEAVAAARKADTALLFVGYADGWEAEACDRPFFKLPGRQDELIRAVARANPRTVVVLQVGSPVPMPWIDDMRAVLLALNPGMEGGTAIVDALTGRVNPCGKLPVTFPKRIEDAPAFRNFPGDKTVRYAEGVFVGYRWYDARRIAPLFSFGHGLSYTTWEYSDLRAAASKGGRAPDSVSLLVRNTGTCAGAETVQVYARRERSSSHHPVHTLVGFAKVALKPGASRRVTVALDERSCAYFDAKRGAWTVDGGVYVIEAAASSRDIRLSARVCVRAGSIPVARVGG
jgi:beta-glucosidase